MADARRRRPLAQVQAKTAAAGRDRRVGPPRHAPALRRARPGHRSAPHDGADARRQREHGILRGALTPNGLLGFVAFANTSTIGSVESGAKLFETYAPAGGVGLRVLLNKRSRTNLTTDWGWGKAGSSGFYLGIQEAF